MTRSFTELVTAADRHPLRTIRLSLASSTSYLGVAVAYANSKEGLFRVDHRFSSLDDIKKSELEKHKKGLGVLALIGSLSTRGLPGENHIWDIFEKLRQVNAADTPTVFIPLSANDIVSPGEVRNRFTETLDISNFAGDTRKSIEEGLALAYSTGIRHGAYV
jgi:hypothetical protein